MTSDEPGNDGAAGRTDFQRVVVPTPAGEVVECGPRELLSDHATRFMMEHVAIPPSARVAEVGCGTGVLSIYAALAGAAQVTGTDIDDAALSAARLNGHINGVPQVRFLKGSLLDPVSGSLDLVIALLPHKPSPEPFSHRYYGGNDGTDLVIPVIGQAAKRLVGGGSLYLYLNSIANGPRVMDLFSRLFDVALLAEKKRYFTRQEFDSLAPAMFAHLQALKEKGIASYFEDDDGLFFMVRVYEGKRR